MDSFSDSLPLFKATFPGHGSYSLEALYQEEFSEHITAHDSVADVAALDHLLITAKIDVQSSAVTSASGAEVSEFNVQNADMLSNFSPLVNTKSLSRAMSSKAAASGLSLWHVQITHHHDKKNGVEQMFMQPVAGGRRVTATKRIPSAVKDFLFKDKA